MRSPLLLLRASALVLLTTACGAGPDGAVEAVAESEAELQSPLQAPFPPPFSASGATYLWADIQTQRNVISVDGTSGTASLESTTIVEQRAPGRLVFDYVPEPQSVLLDGKPVALVDVTLPEGRATENGSARAVAVETAAGTHTLQIRGPWRTGFAIGGAGAQRFFHCDLSLNDRAPRGYTERYFPSTVVADRYPSTVRFEWRGFGASAVPVVVANGAVTTGAGFAVVTYPDWYNSAAPFLLVDEASQVDVRSEDFTSVDGHTVRLSLAQARGALAEATLADRARKSLEGTRAVLARFEGQLGPFPHDQLITVFRAPYGSDGDMEYAGATNTAPGTSNFIHEVIHSYFGRSLFPADGDAEWLDESITTWLERPDGKRLQSAAPSRTAIGKENHCTCNGPYGRGMFGEAYRGGTIGHLAYLMGGEAPMLAFLKELHASRRHGFLTTKILFDELEAAAKAADPAGYAARLDEGAMKGIGLRERFDDILWDPSCPSKG